MMGKTPVQKGRFEAPKRAYPLVFFTNPKIANVGGWEFSTQRTAHGDGTLTSACPTQPLKYSGLR